ncbi:hypothetical protein G7Y82_16290 [Solimonas sp. C16B3]|uniref:Enamine deaminase RidA, house cleaning of reactive enamine intermediates, YjgF/YER057c/UK114 family n=2 Tax=Solimonas marina TaxID=2714601 RepID=A0A970BA00_9GAMM|nr:hypothetical protein [Solimonas marina]
MKKWWAPTLVGAMALSAVAYAADQGGIKIYRGERKGGVIAKAVEVPGDKTLIFLSGKTGPIINKDVPKDTVAARGDMETQTRGALTAIQEQLKSLGLDMKDVVKATVFMVGDPDKGGELDKAGMNKAFGEFFGTDAQPNVPARSAFQVAGLAGKGALVEIEVIAARP